MPITFDHTRIRVSNLEQSIDWDRIAEGRLKKWFKEVTLVNQAFIKDNKQTVSQYVAGNGGGKVTSFARVALG